MVNIIPFKNNNSLAYAQYGDENGTPILINHGLIASIKDSSIFERLIGMGARLICIARPGYGASSPYRMENIGEWADIVSALVEELQLSHFDVLGMSSGAPYSYAIGYGFPEKARNIYIFSGIPAMYDGEVLALWPFPVNKNASLDELKELANELFFSNLASEDLEKNDVRDSMINDCFGIAQDFKLRCVDWGFSLSDVRQKVFMQHSRADQSVPFRTAEITSKLLPGCEMVCREDGVHFSDEALDDFIQKVIEPNFQKS